jgi:hypothetical protein
LAEKENTMTVEESIKRIEVATDAIVNDFRKLHSQRQAQNLELALVAAQVGYRFALAGESLESVLEKVKASFQ